MTERHKLDDKVEEVLQHYGIKGMRWDVIRTPEQIAAARGESASQQPGGAGGDDSGDVDEGLLEELGASVSKIFNNVSEKLDDVGDSIKKKGKSLLTSIFGKAGDGKWKKAKQSNSKAAKKLKEQMAKYNRSTPEGKARMKKNANKFIVTRTDERGNTTKTVKTTKKGPFGLEFKSTSKSTTYSTSPRSTGKGSGSKSKNKSKGTGVKNTNSKLVKKVQDEFARQEKRRTYESSKK